MQKPDDRSAPHLPRALPTQEHLTESRHQNRQRARQQHPHRLAALAGPREMRLKGPERPDKRQPVGQTCPSQTSVLGQTGPDQHQQPSQQQRLAPTIPPQRLLPTTTAADAGDEQANCRQQSAGGQKEQPKPKRLAPDAPIPDHANTAVRPR